MESMKGGGWPGKEERLFCFEVFSFLTMTYSFFQHHPADSYINAAPFQVRVELFEGILNSLSPRGCIVFGANECAWNPAILTGAVGVS